MRPREQLPPVGGFGAQYPLVPGDERPAVQAVVERVLADHPDELKVTPGKMVYELQPKLDCDKGKAVLYLSGALDLERDDALAVLDSTEEEGAISRHARTLTVAYP